MPKRVSERRRWRLPCELRIGASRYSALVLDVSSTGLFVQTNARTSPGDRFELTLSLPEGQEAELAVEVARRKVVPAQLLALAQGGVGVRIVRASESYYAYLEELGIDARSATPASGGEGASRAGEEEEEASELQRYRVRISQESGPRSRRLEVEAPDAEAARVAALDTVGEGWKVLDVEPL